jgi:hypothetical protein
MVAKNDATNEPTDASKQQRAPSSEGVPIVTSFVSSHCIDGPLADIPMSLTEFGTPFQPQPRGKGLPACLRLPAGPAPDRAAVLLFFTSMCLPTTTRARCELAFDSSKKRRRAYPDKSSSLCQRMRVFSFALVIVQRRTEWRRSTDVSTQKECSQGTISRQCLLSKCPTSTIVFRQFESATRHLVQSHFKHTNIIMNFNSLRFLISSASASGSNSS